MSYLLTQMFLYLAVAFLLGLILGWLIWRYGQASTGDLDAMRAERDALAKERDDLQVNLDACRARSSEERSAVEALRADKIDLQTRLDGMINERNAMPEVAAPVAASALSSGFTGTSSKPQGIDAPRGGVADNLQDINGVGPALERLLHGLGYYHFDQIAEWTPAEEAWVDDNLEGFKGRVSRDNWISQAKEFARR